MPKVIISNSSNGLIKITFKKCCINVVICDVVDEHTLLSLFITNFYLIHPYTTCETIRY